ncbi:MAG TPA: hypothetical protein VMT35_03005, partial [Ignavibacteriaceae bacterium]|nr:hypothetical protein [Ignavibacteriaceae bacterium]
GNLSSPSFTYIQGSSELNNFPQNGIGIRNNDGISELTFASTAGNDNIDTALHKVGRFCLKNGIPFTASEFQISWNFSGIINTIITGSGFSNITSPDQHTNLLFYPDTTAPKLLKAECININNIRLDFSEELEKSSAENTGNYSIDNGIDIESASLSPEGTAVTLKTSEHLLNINYTLTALNLSDRAGNNICPPWNSIQYTFHGIHKLALKFFLEGPFRNGKMETNLRKLNLLPKTQPYNKTPWNYHGSEYTDSLPADVVDWVLVELRSGIPDSTTKYRRTAFVKNDGTLLDPDGNAYLTMTNLQSGNYYVVVKHRNHLTVMSSEPVRLAPDSLSFYDFSSSQNKAYGNAPEADLGGNIFGIYSGDGNGSGEINDNDYKDVWKPENGSMGYEAGDYDLNGGVNISDKNLFWRINKGKVTQVP